MGILRDLLEAPIGSPWWVNYKLGAAATATLVSPHRTFRRRGAFEPSPADTTNVDASRLILLGFHYAVDFAANGNFTLAWRDHTVTPALPRTILYVEGAAGAAEHIEGGMDFCFIPGPGGAVVDGAIEHGADLEITTVQSNTGSILVWGIEVPADLRLMKQYHGSPVFDFGSP